MKYMDFLPIITGCCGAFTAWLFSRKKQAAEVDSVELDNVEKATAIWRELAEDLKKQVDSLRTNQQQIIAEQSNILFENRALGEKIGQLTIQNEKLTKEIRTLEGKVQTLTRENKKLIAQISNKQ